MALNIKATALAAGISWALGVLLVGWAGALGMGTGFVDMMGQYYLGYTATWLGGIIGAIWGFVDAAICGLVFSWLYNKFEK